MRYLLAFVAASFLGLRPGYAADITVAADGTYDRPALIMIKGILGKEEREKNIGEFANIVFEQTGAQRYKRTGIVFLDSLGGDVRTAIAIGRLIRKYEFSTVVAENAKCHSACSLIWLAGVERYIGNNTYLGFHAVRSPDGTVSSHGNAIVGAYLYEMGIKDDDVIIYLTKAPPTSMIWVGLNQAHEYGINAKPFSFTQDQWLWASKEIDKRQLGGVDLPMGVGLMKDAKQ